MLLSITISSCFFYFRRSASSPCSKSFSSDSLFKDCNAFPAIVSGEYWTKQSIFGPNFENISNTHLLCFIGVSIYLVGNSANLKAVISSNSYQHKPLKNLWLRFPSCCWSTSSSGIGSDNQLWLLIHFSAQLFSSKRVLKADWDFRLIVLLFQSTCLNCLCSCCIPSIMQLHVLHYRVPVHLRTQFAQNGEFLTPNTWHCYTTSWIAPLIFRRQKNFKQLFWKFPLVEISLLCRLSAPLVFHKV